MSKESADIVEAILSLKPQGGIFKDYVFPVSVSLFSALMGGSIALMINAKQEVRKANQKKLQDTNELLFNVTKALNSLVTAKSNYYPVKYSTPSVRALRFPEILSKIQEINDDVSYCSYVRDIPTCNLTRTERLSRFYKRLRKIPLNRPSQEALGKSWRNLNRVSAMLGNYNLIIELINKRNKIDEAVREKLAPVIESKEISTEAQFDDAIHSCLSKKQYLNWIDLTEMLITTVDHTICEMDNFLKDFPDIAESNIDLLSIMSKSRLIRVNNDRPAYIELMKPVLTVDFVALGADFSVDPEQLKQRYTLNAWY
ncbi:hypothetical protein LLQ54_21975 [Rouxiella badensis]|uniref:hypothetical protein n=1 Tax=Rouxiella badensis TaxID=1646377 RepID=UPI001D141CE0|nr:hypothetical protein [Rouxiella badensis]MCC3742542.1 hypothetical protein [Rouxiella badensis]